MAFMEDLRDRLVNRIQLTTDGHRAYLEAVEGAFGADIDYAMLVKVYGAAPEGEKRYSPAECLGAVKASDRRQPRSQARQHVLRGTQQSQYSDALAPDDAAHQRLFKEDREPRARDGAALSVLQFRPGP